MKAYVLHNASPLTPFKKTASEIRFRRCTIGSKLKDQLSANKIDVVPVNNIDVEGIKPRSLVIQDDVFFSDSFLPLFLKSIPNRKRNYQCAIDTSRFTLTNTVSPEASIRKIPLYYYGNPTDSETVESIELTPKALFTVSEGLPALMHTFEEMRAYFLDFYALHIERWFDLQSASSLYCRDFVAKIVKPANSLLPKPIFEKAMTWQWMLEQSNSVGKNCQIHPTAILEGCVIGDNVSIGPYAYLRSSVVGDNAVLREYSTTKMSYIGEGAFIAGTDIVNSYVGDGSSIITPMLYNVVFGEKSFLSGGSGFADFNVGSGSITATIDGEDISTGLSFLGSCVGDNCFIGANMIFAPGKAIPDGTHFLDSGLIKDMPTEHDGTYVLSGNKFLQIPNSFLGTQK